MNSFKINPKIKSIRNDYGINFLSEETTYGNPMHQFEAWLTEVLNSGNTHANAMVLSTVDEDLCPSSRVVLLRNISYGGFTFFTNYRSKKAKDLQNNKNACLLFFWDAFERQIRVEGKIERLPESESDDYFKKRPFENNVAAYISKQSTKIKSRMALETEYLNALKKFENKEVPRPPHWGGYVLIPHTFEFWQGRKNRMHDRIQYVLDKKTNTWNKSRLMP